MSTREVVNRAGVIHQTDQEGTRPTTLCGHILVRPYVPGAVERTEFLKDGTWKRCEKCEWKSSYSSGRLPRRI